MSMLAELKRIGAALQLDCGDASCMFAPRRGGMRTNGGCTCDVALSVEMLVAKFVTASLDAAQWKQRAEHAYAAVAVGLRERADEADRNGMRGAAGDYRIAAHVVMEMSKSVTR